MVQPREIAAWGPRPLPVIDADSGFFWKAGEAGSLRVQRCACGRYQHPPMPRCLACGGGDVSPVDVSGVGRVATFTINHQPWRRELPVPYVFAAVELAEQEQLYLLTNIVDCDPEDVAIGMPVEVFFVQHEDVWLPLFRPRGDKA
jgi:uncharacterized OB-fold protein